MMRRLILQIAAIGAATVSEAATAAPAIETPRSLVLPSSPHDPCGRISVEVVGRVRAKSVLVLLPGYGAGAGLMTVAARNLSKADRDLQVWLPERREQNLIPASGSDPRCSAASAKVAAWGLQIALGDVRRVVKAAAGGGRRRVILGGHSWGATEALLYAAWDFGGSAGYRDLAGLLLIDGGVHDSFAGEGLRYRITSEQAEKGLEEIGREPFDATLSQLIGSTEPAAAGEFYQAAARLALAAPSERSMLSERLPRGLRPSGTVTNLALIGWLFDAGAPVADVKLHLGHFTESPVRDWMSDDPSVTNGFIASAGSDHPMAWEHYWPKRLTLDLEAADGFVETPATRLLGLPLTHARTIDVPLYVFQTGLTKGSVNESGRWVARQSNIRNATFAEDQAMSHMDPLFAAPDHNRFISTAIFFLKGISASYRPRGAGLESTKRTTSTSQGNSQDPRSTH